MMHRGRASLATLQHALFASPVALDELQAYYRLMQPESQRAMWDMTFFDLPRLRARALSAAAGAGRRERHPGAAGAGRAGGARLWHEAEIFPGMGHVMMLEARWQKVADRIIEWLRKAGLDRK